MYWDKNTTMEQLLEKKFGMNCCGGDWCHEKCMDCNTVHCVESKCLVEDWVHICIPCDALADGIECWECGGRDFENA